MPLIPSFTDSADPRARGRASSFGRGLCLTILLMLSMTLGGMIGAGFNPEGNATASTMLSQLEEFQIVEETYDTIRSSYVLADEFSDQELMYGASRGMIDALGDEGHSTFLDPQEALEFERSARGELIGIGIQVDTTGPQPIVVAPIDGSPAFDVGIRSGDVIIAVDGVQSTDVTPQELVDLIRGKEGTDVTVTLRRQNELEPYEVTITRARIDVRPVSYRMLPEGVLWLRVSQFSSGATEGVVEALRFGQQQGMTGVVLDLRNNPGGLVFEAIGIGSQFIPGGSVLYQEQNADGSVHEVRTIGTEGEWQRGELAVLINEGSASASEIVSSGIRDNDRGQLYGETTFGTGTVLLPFELSDGSVALLGTKLWLTASGEEIWKRGVEPETVVTLEPGVSPRLPIEFETKALTEDDLAGVEDTQLLTAFRSLVSSADA
jgi:carboxyl-terminal processing protease